MISLPRPLARDLHAHLCQAAPEECCGLLTGVQTGPRTWQVTGLARSPNIARTDRQTTFEVDPALRFKLMRAGETIIGHYHSHPAGEARPSATDAAMTFEPELIWIIASTHEMRAYLPNPDDASGFDELTLYLTEE